MDILHIDAIYILPLLNVLLGAKSSKNKCKDIRFGNVRLYNDPRQL